MCFLSIIAPANRLKTNAPRPLGPRAGPQLQADRAVRPRQVRDVPRAAGGGAGRRAAGGAHSGAAEGLHGATHQGALYVHSTTHTYVYIYIQTN